MNQNLESEKLLLAGPKRLSQVTFYTKLCTLAMRPSCR